MQVFTTNVSPVKKSVLAMAIAALCGIVGPAALAEGLAEHVPGELLVQFKADAADADKAQLREVLRAQLRKAIRSAPMRAAGRGDLEVLRLHPGVGVAAAMRLAAGHPAVEYAEPNYLYHRQLVPNDPLYLDGSLWGMYGDTTTPANSYGSQAGEAWALNYLGSRNVHVGVIDEGLQISHPDLRFNVWRNPFDAADSIDNDGNGYIDDRNGWDFFSNDNTVYDGSGDDHGTHVSGTIGARGYNSTGVVGVNWVVKLISAKFLGPFGGSTADAVEAVDYITDLKTRHGLDIVATSNSWSGGGYSQALYDAIVRGANAGILFVAAAGNATSNNDVIPTYPANYNTTPDAGYDAVISVAAITSTGGLASFSNFGASTVDLGAPGEDVVSTVPPGQYAFYSGTSMATPHVSGSVALYAAACPSTPPDLIRQALLSSTVPTPSLVGKTVTNGRLDVAAMIAGGCL